MRQTLEYTETLKTLAEIARDTEIKALDAMKNYEATTHTDGAAIFDVAVSARRDLMDALTNSKVVDLLENLEILRVKNSELEAEAARLYTAISKLPRSGVRSS